MANQDCQYSNENVLVVDDEESVREPVVRMLQTLGFRARGAGSAEEALELLKNDKYTFLLTDINMPKMDGLELIARVKNEYPELCSIAMTGYTKKYRYIDVINAGATDFVNKPFNIEELEAKLKRAIIERNVKEELSRLSITDALTGLYNQRQFYARLKEEMRRAERQNHPLALILLDLDNFKEFNDTHGHVAGDELLRKIGKIILSSIRDGVDSGYRYGGDEFAIILIDADMEIGRGIGKRIERAIENECGITASAGFASFVNGMTEPEELVAKADERLYRFKGKRKEAEAGGSH